ncbi:glycoside hydrolase [Serendipita vermifera]|nr:glycoside hydrolase [Serendipita vermifera]
MWRNLLIAALFCGANAIHLTVSREGGNKTSDLLYGIMYEDINHSGDGGLYAELIRNRAFQGSATPTLEAYRAIGGVTLHIDKNNSLSAALPNVLRIDVPAGTRGEVGFLNEGFWGINVEPQRYEASFYTKGFKGPFNVSLRSNATGKSYATERVSSSNPSKWTQVSTKLVPNRAAPDTRNVFAVTFDAEKVAGKSVFFNLVSLFPPTYNDRKNGLRPELMKAFADLKGSFLRFPGGNNLEGNHIQERWKWNETIGPLIDRPGRPGAWGYANTDGLGLLEYCLWAEDLGLELILGVYSGLSLSGTDIVPKDQLAPFIQEALDEIEYVRGDLTTKYGKLRAQHGHPKPFKLHFVEVGNEDWLSNGLESYNQYRLKAYNDAIKAKYPDITIIASTEQATARSEGMWIDTHLYLRPDGFYRRFNWFDNWDRRYPVFVGEYAAVQPNDPVNRTIEDADWSSGAPRFAFPSLIAAVGEAVFTIGMERNADLVKLIAYAPVLQNVDGWQWVPDLISFTANPKDTVRSYSYYVQQLFSQNRGTKVLPVTSKNGSFDPVFWVASINERTGAYVLKFANYDGAATSITVKLPDASKKKGVITTLTGPSPDSYNSINNSTSILKSKDIHVTREGEFKVDLASWSVVVAVFP